MPSDESTANYLLGRPLTSQTLPRPNGHHRHQTGDATREEILVIASELFRANTYAGTTMADIAERLGTTKAALYHYFCSKHAILNELFADGLKDFADLVSLSERRPRPSHEEILYKFADNIAAFPEIAVLMADQSAVAEYLRYNDQTTQVAAVRRALSGARPSKSRQYRVEGAMASVRNATIAAVAAEGKLRPAIRADVVAMGLRALDG